MKTNSHILRSAARRLLALVILGSLTSGAFATLGDGKTTGPGKSRKILSTQTSSKPGSFSLKSGYTFRGSQVISQKPASGNYISLNTVVTYQQGHTTYTMPMTKKVILNNKITFNPNSATR